jgi:hypothetical protein
MPKLGRKQNPQDQKGIVQSTKIRKRQAERDSWRGREMPERVIYDFNLIYKVADLAMYARVQ